MNMDQLSAKEEEWLRYIWIIWLPVDKIAMIGELRSMQGAVFPLYGGIPRFFEKSTSYKIKGE